jgi:TLC domain
MLDPMPPPPPWLSSSITTPSNTFSFPTLPFHIHELVASFLFYQFIQTVFSPLLSSYLFPHIYPHLPRRTKINWDVHVVSLVQSCSINAAALWVMWVDEERKSMSALERVYGYTGGCGMIQGLAAGYFLWDLVVTSRYLGIFGVGMWAHAVCALCVFSFGFVRESLSGSLTFPASTGRS